MAASNVTDPDVWWHLRTGELILQNHSVFHSDPYSFTCSGCPWVDHEWLSQILIFGLYRTAGFGGLTVAFAAVIVTALFLAFLRCPGRPYLAGLVTIWGAFASAQSWGVRPQMFTFLLASVFLMILDRSYERPGLLWWMLPVMLLWVNLHAGYAVGIGLLLLSLLGDMLDRAFGWTETSQFKQHFGKLSLVTAACLLVVPLNPYGWRMYAYPLETLRSRAMQAYIGEWASPDFHHPQYLPVLFMMLATLGLAAFSPRRLRPRELAVLLPMNLAALHAVRHIPIYTLVAMPMLAAMIHPCWQRFAVPSARLHGKLPALSKALVNAVILLGFLVYTAARVRHVVRGQAQAEQENFPAAAVNFLQQRHPPGPILNHYNWGGYFIWKIYPEYRVFVDGRADLYGDSFLNELASVYYLTGASWQGPLEKWSIPTVVLPPDAPLVTALRGQAGWHEIYADRQAVVLTRRR